MKVSVPKSEQKDANKDLVYLDFALLVAKFSLWNLFPALYCNKHVFESQLIHVAFIQDKFTMWAVAEEGKLWMNLIKHKAW